MVLVPQLGNAERYKVDMVRWSTYQLVYLSYLKYFAMNIPKFEIITSTFRVRRVRHVGLMCTLFLIGNLYLSGITYGKTYSYKLTTKRHVLQCWALIKIGLHSQTKDTILGSKFQHSLEGLCDHLKRERDFTLFSCNFYIPTLVLKGEMVILVIHKCLLEETTLDPI